MLLRSVFPECQCPVRNLCWMPSRTQRSETFSSGTHIHRADPCLAGDQIAHTKPGSLCRCIALSFQSVKDSCVLLALLHAGCSSPAQHLDGVTSPWRVGCLCLHDITVKSAYSASSEQLSNPSPSAGRPSVAPIAGTSLGHPSMYPVVVPAFASISSSLRSTSCLVAESAA